MSETHSDDAAALHHIFSSSSSIRGYHTAAATPGYKRTSRPSLDLDFKFGEPSTPRPTSRVEQLGQHIKQKLSGGHLSRTSSKKSIQKSLRETSDLGGIAEASPPDVQGTGTAPASHSTARLSCLLASRNASQGGYDSDAKSLDSPVLASSAGTITLKSGLVQQTLEKLESQRSSIRSLTSPPSKLNRVSGHGRSNALKGLPPIPSVPLRRMSFVDALQMRNDETPKEVLRRVSSGVDEGSIEISTSPGVRPGRLPSIMEAKSDWHLLPPKRSSSLPRSIEIRKKHDSSPETTIARDKRDTTSESGKRISLISELYPQYLEYAEHRNSSDTADVVVPVPRPTKELDYSNTNGAAPPVQLDATMAPSRSNTMASSLYRDSDSVHLFNMRISQRLASQIQLPVRSPTISPSESRRSFSVDDSRMVSGHRRISNEHNRQPSDPATRLLFENFSKARDQSQSWKTVTSAHSGSSRRDVHQALQDNASSCYLSNTAPPTDSHCSTARVSRRQSLLNPHSLAVGGRSVSGDYSDIQRHNRGVNPDSGPSSATQRRNRRSSENNPPAASTAFNSQRLADGPVQRAREREISPTPLPKHLRESRSRAEQMSEISIGKAMDRRNENLTEISLTDLKDLHKTVSSATKAGRYDVLRLTDGADSIAQSAPGSIGQRTPKMVGDAHCDRSRRNSKQRRPTQSQSTENAADNWARAFRQARELPPNHDKFLTVPRFDRDGRKRRLTLSTDNVPPVVPRIDSGSSWDTRRSRSVDDALNATALKKHAISSSGSPGPALRASDDTALPRGRLHGQTPKERMPGLGDARQGTSSRKGHTSTTPLKSFFDAWSKFPSHTRAERNGAAGEADDIIARDFLTSAGGALPPKQSDENKPPLNHKWSTILPSSLQKTLNKNKSKSMPLRDRAMLSPAARARQNRKGLLGRWKRMYRSSSTDFRKYALFHGHRSSVSLGDALEYPELECLGGHNHDLLTETCLRRLQESLDAQLSQETETSQRKITKRMSCPESTQSGPARLPRTQAIDWGRYYADCVGSLSALTSEANTPNAETNEPEGSRMRSPVGSPELRDSTLDFQKSLGKEQERVKERLMKKLEDFGPDGHVSHEHQDGQEMDDELKRFSSMTKSTVDTLGASSIKTKDLKIPGSFG
ncbi:uncharacterized protein AB675_11116 [Cyphellophora attinorum]|uniref:Uncharacterized protein n=1 Tax=Cyphellophora attinorum TaxID=1664694 RepID=A0A0N1H335_9EURO|nr:uncharacterized protein AB675_11116 [Phialophora attinorum]KPI35853.1 hypothetical protein AB675_11116 [Phialophora attinorum]